MIAWQSVPSPEAKSCSAWRDLLPDGAEPKSKKKPGNYSPYCPVSRSRPPPAIDTANIKASQRRCGLPLDENDLWIAATALAMNATLVSRDTDFQAIEGLGLVQF
jgi:hypothetical protein